MSKILVNLGMTEAEKQKIKLKAERIGLTLSAYMRMSALSYPEELILGVKQ